MEFPAMPNPISLKRKVAFGVGHVLNDLCASMWFSYLLIFYEKVLQFESTIAGLLLLVGQLADGFCTPIIGILTDKENRIECCANYGRRKVWHFIGTVMVIATFSFIFGPCYLCETPSTAQWLRVLYYSVLIVGFQFGWACTQISHLSLIPVLATRKSLRTELNSIRYAFTVISNLTAYAITYLILEHSTTTSLNVEPFESNSTAIESSDVIHHIGPDDMPNFRNIATLCLASGLVFSIVFHIGVIEPPANSPLTYDEASDTKTMMVKKKKKNRKDWFKEIRLYQVGLLYVATRLYVNIYQVYIPLYVSDTLQLNKTTLATIPLVMCLAGFAMSLIMKPLNRIIGRKAAYIFGCALGIGGSAWTYFGCSDYFDSVGVYLMCSLLGIAGSTVMITCLSVTADMIGSNTENSAFVYGLMSFLDKISNGVIIMIIQELNSGSGDFYRWVLVFGCGLASVFGILVTLSMLLTQPRHDVVEESVPEDSVTTTVSVVSAK